MYKTKFDYNGYEIYTEAMYYSGRSETRYEPAEPPCFDIHKIVIDGKDCSDMDDTELAEVLQTADFRTVWNEWQNILFDINFC